MKLDIFSNPVNLLLHKRSGKMIYPMIRTRNSCFVMKPLRILGIKTEAGNFNCTFISWFWYLQLNYAPPHQKESRQKLTTQSTHRVENKRKTDKWTGRSRTLLIENKWQITCRLHGDGSSIWLCDWVISYKHSNYVVYITFKFL